MLSFVNPNILRLMIAACLVMPGASIIVFVGSLLGHQLAPHPSLSTLPVAMMIVGLAASTIPATILLRRFGRRKGSLIGIGFCLLGAAFGALATSLSSFYLLLLASFLTGVSQVFVQQYRFAAMECADDPQAIPQVLGFMMMAGVVAAWVGPEMAVLGRKLIFQGEYAGAFALLGMMGVLAGAILWGFRNPEMEESNKTTSQRSISEIVCQGPYLFAVLCGAVGYGVMSFLMTATPISMHEMDAHSLDHTKWVIQSHILAMFLPSYITGWLIRKWGVHQIIIAGSLVFVGSIIIAFQGQEVMHYWWSLVLLGIGWNWLFLGGTTLLPTTYQPEERFKAQGINDFLIFGIQASCSLSAGWVLNLWGWQTVLTLSLPVVLIHLVFAFGFNLRRNRLRVRS